MIEHKKIEITDGVEIDLTENTDEELNDYSDFLTPSAEEIEMELETSSWSDIMDEVLKYE